MVLSCKNNFKQPNKTRLSGNLIIIISIIHRPEDYCADDYCDSSSKVLQGKQNTALECNEIDVAQPN